jgi:hypothetical protein
MITPKKIFQFIEGNLKMLGDQFDLMSQHQKEQVLYRSQICKDDCMKFGYCIECGCSVPGKLYVKESCNGGKRFPDLMSREDWEKYKSDNNIIVELL